MGTMLFFSVAIKDLAATKISCLFYLDRKAALEHAAKITSTSEKKNLSACDVAASFATVLTSKAATNGEHVW